MYDARMTAASTAPWWGTGIFVVAAALFGATVALVSTKLSDTRKTTAEEKIVRERYEREDARRWDAEVRDVAAKFIGATSERVSNTLAYHRTIQQILGEKRVSTSRTLLRSFANPRVLFRMLSAIRPSARASKGLATSSREVNRWYAELELVASDPILAKARELHRVSVEIFWKARNRDSRPDAILAYRSCRQELVDALRLELVSRPGPGHKVTKPSAP